jgi:Tfp pilus assembly protein PilE
MKALIVMIATLFTLTVAADRTYQETLKKIERDAHKAKLQAANAYLKRLQAAQDKAMQDKDLKRANLLQAEIDKLKKSYGSKKKDVTVATVKPVQEDVTGRWDITVLHKGRHILLNKDKTAFYSDGVKGTWVIKGTDVTITWTNNTTWLMKLKGDGMSGKDLRGRAVAVVRAVTQMPFELGTYVVPRSGTLITLNSEELPTM